MSDEWEVISDEDLSRIIDLHKIYIYDKSNNVFPISESNRAILRNKDLRDKSELFKKKDLSYADLAYSNLEKADLRGVKFDKTNLNGTRLHDANLQNADLSGALFLKEEQLSGADLTSAKLPKELESFKSIEQVNEGTKGAKKLFAILNVSCLYLLFTLFSTKTTSLIAGNLSTNLPFLNIVLPIKWFYCFSWVYFIGIYVYYHIIMLRLWEVIKGLPAIFPDGRRVDQRICPWLVTGIVPLYFHRLQDYAKNVPLLHKQDIGVNFLSWWVMPLSIVLLWGRYLQRHELFWSFVHIGAITAISYMGMLTYLKTKAILHDVHNYSWSNLPYKRVYLSLAISAFIILTSLTVDTIERNTDSLLMQFFPSLHPYLSIDLSHLKVSKMPEPWDGDVDNVDGAIMTGMYMPKVNASEAFLVKANLRDANMAGADFTRARLDKAVMIDADLEAATFEHTKMQNAELRRANLNGAIFDHTDMSGSNLNSANLRDVHFIKTDMSKADLSTAFIFKLSKKKPQNTDMKNVVFEHITLTGAKITDTEMTNVTIHSSNLQSVNLTYSRLNGSQISKSDLSNATLERVDFTGGAIENSNLSNADMNMAILKGAVLRDVDLRGAKNLTASQLAATKEMSNVKLDDNIVNEIKKLTPPNNSQINTQK